MTADGSWGKRSCYWFGTSSICLNPSSHHTHHFLLHLGVLALILALPTWQSSCTKKNHVQTWSDTGHTQMFPGFWRSLDIIISQSAIKFRFWLMTEWIGSGRWYSSCYIPGQAHSCRLSCAVIFPFLQFGVGCIDQLIAPDPMPVLNVGHIQDKSAAVELLGSPESTLFGRTAAQQEELVWSVHELQLPVAK